MRLLQLNLFDKRELIPLLRGDPVERSSFNPNQLTLALS